MQSLTNPPKGLVIAAVAFDELQDSVVRTAWSFARAFDMELRLVNVLDMPVMPLFIDSTGYSLIAGLDSEGVQTMMHERRRRLAGVADTLVLGDRVRVDVISGDSAASAIIDYACLHRANLVIAACSPKADYFPNGLSTSLTLLVDAPLPIMVLPNGVCFDAQKKSDLRLLVADDLQEGSEEAVRRAFELAARGCGTLRQLHIHGDLREIARDWWRDFESAHPRLLDPQHKAAAMLEQDAKVRLERLKSRGQPYRSHVESSGVKVETDCRLGKVGRELHESVSEFGPDLLVFGRHKIMKVRPYVLGRMPFGAMLREHRPILVVPPASELYLNMPFPASV